jgi:hypothetical protein
VQRAHQGTSHRADCIRVTAEAHGSDQALFGLVPQEGPQGHRDGLGGPDGVTDRLDYFFVANFPW